MTIEGGGASCRRCCATSCSCASRAAARPPRSCCGSSPRAAGACPSGCWRRSPSSPTRERDEALREAVEHRLLVPAGEDVYAFRHALLREAVYQELLPGERNRLHAACGAALAAQPELAGGPDAAAADLAHHWYAAHDLPRALAASVAAGRVAERRSGFAEARAHYERALELWDRVADAEARAGPRSRGADAAGRRGREPRRRPRARGGADPRRAARRSADATAAGLLWERLGRFLWAAGDSLTALEAYEEAVRLVPAEPPSAARARVLAARGQGLMLLSRHQESRACCEEAIAIARAVGARAEEGHALNTLGCDLGYLGDPAAAVAHLVQRARDRRRGRRPRRPRPRLPEPLRAARPSAQPPRRGARARARGDRAVAARRAGGRLRRLAADDRRRRPVRAGRAGTRPRRSCSDAADRHPIEMAAIDLHQVSREAPRRAAATSTPRSATSTRARRLMIKTVDPQYQAELRAREAELALWRGRPDEARAAAAAGLRRPGRHRRRLVRRSAAVARRCGRRPTRATGDCAALLERARAIAAAGERGRFIPAVTTAYALLCEAEVARGEPDPWQRAAEAWEALGHPFPAAYARWRQAEALLARRRAREGAEVLVAAHAAAERLGAAPLARELALLARRARVDSLAPPEPAAAPPSPGAALGLTRREREVLGLVAEGLTNREIAQALFVTEKTAGAHVSSILAQAARAQPARGRDRGAAPRARAKDRESAGPRSREVSQCAADRAGVRFDAFLPRPTKGAMHVRLAVLSHRACLAAHRRSARSPLPRRRAADPVFTEFTAGVTPNSLPDGRRARAGRQPVDGRGARARPDREGDPGGRGDRVHRRRHAGSDAPATC